MKARNILIIILVVVLLAVYSVIITDYLKQRNENMKLKTQVVDTTSALAIIPLPPADLEQRLATAQKNLDAVKNPFNIDTNDTRIINNILELAKAQGVKAIPLGTQVWVLENVLDQIYSVFRIDMAVTGSYQRIASFLNQLENGESQTLIIESFTVDTISGSSLLDASARNAQLLSASITIAIYASPMETD